MKRREFLGLLVGTAAAWPLAATALLTPPPVFAQERARYRLGVLSGSCVTRRK